MIGILEKSECGEAVPPALQKLKCGRKVSKDTTKEGDDRRVYNRVRYRIRTQKTRVINSFHVRSKERGLRPRAKYSN